jgi:peptidoglycan/xylan/chitin deacetylase (PgdA/CDA1 family)
MLGDPTHSTRRNRTVRRIAPLAWAVILVLMGGLLLAAILSRGSGSRSAEAASSHARPPGRPASSAPAHLRAADIRRLHVDEGGLVPVLMYHRIVDPIPAGDPYDRTPAQLRADLARLDREGYSAISMSDFVAGRIDVPAGRSPVVLTFDDSSRSQFRMLGDGQVDPDSAVGIMNTFAAEHPEFGRHAIFYANATLFEQPADTQRKLDALVRWGYEIGNHTYSHANLATLSPQDAQEEIGKLAALVRRYEPGYRIRHFCIPFGVEPHEQGLTTHGVYAGVPYHYVSDVMVGAGPSPSPFAKRFDPAHIARIRAAGGPSAPLQIDDWLSRLNRGDRYVSDGDPATITVPADLVPKVRVPEGMRLRSF